MRYWPARRISVPMWSQPVCRPVECDARVRPLPSPYRAQRKFRTHKRRHQTSRWKTQREHIADFKFDVAETSLNCFCPRRFQKLFCQINSYHVPRGSDCLSSWQSRSSSPAANIKHSRTAWKRRLFNRSTSEIVPEAEW